MAQEQSDKKQVKQIQIRISDEVMRGSYANIVRIDTTREEFIFDFGALNPQQASGIITNRIFMNPGHVKRMIDVLNRVMTRYESQHGQVAPAEQNQEIGFQTS
jgi:hypothetical protein